MKRKCTIMLLIFFWLFCSGVNQDKIVSHAQSKDKNLEGYTADYQEDCIKIKVISATNKKFKVRITNDGDEKYYYSQTFKLKIKKKGKWRNLKFEKEVKMHKCIPYIPPHSSETLTIKWKTYYNNPLKKGKYKLVWPNVFDGEFKIK